MSQIHPHEIKEHEAEEFAERKARCPAWGGWPPGWAGRSRCDRCRAPLAYISSNFAVPQGTPVVCGPCTREGPP